MLLSFCPTWHSSQSSFASNMLCYGCFSNHFFPCSWLGLCCFPFFFKINCFQTILYTPQAFVLWDHQLSKGMLHMAKSLFQKIFKKVNNESNIKSIVQTCTNVDQIDFTNNLFLPWNYMHGKITIKHIHKKLQIILYKLKNATKLHMKLKSPTHSRHFGTNHVHYHCCRFAHVEHPHTISHGLIHHHYYPPHL